MKKNIIISILLLLPGISFTQAIYNYIKTNEIRPRTNDEIQLTAPLKFPDGSIQSYASSKPPILSIKMHNDSLVYEMTTPSNPYNLLIEAQIKRPFGSTPITNISINGISYPVPQINEGETYTEYLPISFFPDGTGLTNYSKEFNVICVALNDTISKSLTLTMGFKLYIGALIIQGQGFDVTEYDMDYSTIAPNGDATFFDFQPNGNQIGILIPSVYANKTFIINGIITSNFFKPITLSQPNKSNNRGAVTHYTFLFTKSSYLRKIQKIQIQ